MRRFALLYPNIEFTKQVVSQLPWGHIVRLMQMVKDQNPREWYGQKTLEHGWSRSILEMQIASDLYGRQGISEHKISNYHQHLSIPQSDLAQQILKDPYNFDFLA